MKLVSLRRIPYKQVVQSWTLHFRRQITLHNPTGQRYVDALISLEGKSNPDPAHSSTIRQKNSLLAA